MANPYAPQKLTNGPNLTPEQLLELQRSLRGGSAYSMGGMDWTNNGFAGTGESGSGAYDPTEYYSAAPGKTGEVHPYSVYDLQGNYKGDSTTHPVDFKKTAAQWAIMAAAMAAGGYGLMGGFGAGAGVGGGVGVDAFGVGTASGLDAAVTGGGGGLLGGGTAFNAAADSQLYNAALQAGGGDALAGYSAAGATPGSVSIGGTTYGGGGLLGGAGSDGVTSGSDGWGYDGPQQTFNAAKDSQLANVDIDAAGGNSLSGYQAPGATPSAVSINGTTYGAGAPVPGGPSLPGNTSDWIKAAATIGGGLLGSKGSQNEASTTQHMDPRMDALTYGDLFQRAQGLLGEQMTPERRAGYRTMQTQGQTLMNTPVAPNGTARFFGSNHLA